MRKLKNFWQTIPRQLRAAGNSLLVLLLAVTFYVCIGSPTLTERQAFRRAEKANQVGPSIILLDADTENYDFEHLILAETEQGVITYASSDTWTPVFCYHEKTGDVTVVTAPEGPFGWRSPLTIITRWNPHGKRMDSLSFSSNCPSWANLTAMAAAPTPNMAPTAMPWTCWRKPSAAKATITNTTIPAAAHPSPPRCGSTANPAI